MSSLEIFFTTIKPAMDGFLRAPDKESLARLEQELEKFNWSEMKIFHIQILLPLVLKLEELSEENQDLRTGAMNCLRTVISNLYLKEVKGLRTMLVILLRQIRDFNSATMRPNLSEEIKLATLECINESLRRSTSDVIEEFYTKESSMLLGQLLLALTELVEKEKYRKLVISAMQCLMVVFYVHDESDIKDVVLRSQVANELFMYLPKIVTVLFKTSIADEKTGETLKSLAIKVLGRILCIMYEETDDTVLRTQYTANEFKALFEKVQQSSTINYNTAEIFFKPKNKEQLGEHLQRLQGAGRTEQWYKETSSKLRTIFLQTGTLRAHQSIQIRREYAQFCCDLMLNCAVHLEDNFVLMLESVVAMTEDDDEQIRRLCEKTLQALQDNMGKEEIFDENCEQLFDEHLTKLPRIIHRCDESEQYAELMFLKGFLRQLSAEKMQLLLAVPRNLELLCMCLLAAADIDASRGALIEEYSLRQVLETDYSECAKLPWRKYKNLSSERCVKALEEICGILGRTQIVNRSLLEYLLELLTQQNSAMNEILLVSLWLVVNDAAGDRNTDLLKLFVEEVLDDKHWHLALQPDQAWRLKVNKPSDWFVDQTPGLYESAVEIRTQDCDSDDDEDLEDVNRRQRVTVADAQFNVIHTCLTLDVLAHCASFLGEQYDRYLFRSLHKVLLKVASSNTLVYQAATYALVSIQKALHLGQISQLIEMQTDYITYHLNTILRKAPESQAAVDILTVVLQFSSRNALPHLEGIFQTIREECSKDYQSENVNSYLRVFNAFLTHVSRWHFATVQTIDDIPMQTDTEDTRDADDLIKSWLDILNGTDEIEDEFQTEQTTGNENENLPTAEQNPEQVESGTDESKPPLPRHIEMIKDLLHQLLKFLTSTNQVQQILVLECLNTGIPLLKDYEDELLPLVHLIWQPLMEKFRQKDALVLNRCFTLLTTLATHAKDFILKRSLDDVIPFLIRFLQSAAKHSIHKTINVQTQEYKLQVKLLQDFSTLIQSLEIDEKPFNDILEVVAFYLSQEQPKQLQELAVDFYISLRLYNAPFVYVIVFKKLHLKEYKHNVTKILKAYGINC